MMTSDFSGLGFAEKLHREGEDVLVVHETDAEEAVDKAGAKHVGKNLVPLMPLSEWMPQRSKYKDAYIFFDQNHLEDERWTLDKEKFPRLLGSTELTNKMEHNRDFAVSLVKKAGLLSPETQEFVKLLDGTDWLDANPDKAYVFKPNEPGNGWETYVPDSEKDPAANEELHAYLSSLSDNNSAGYILQERIKGVETNFEIWLHNGTPYFAYCELECKKKLNDDLGGLVGGAQDINFTVPLNAKGIRETVGKLAALPEFKNFTGFIDMNVIVAERDNYFLEFCARFGYPSHPTLLFGLAKDPLGDILVEMIDGPKGNFYDHFRFGFGAGITLYTDKARKGLPIYVSEEVDKKFHHYDSYRRGELMLLSGYGMEVGVITGHGYSATDAAEDALLNAKKINFPNRAFRTDLDKNNYFSNPHDRYQALEAMRYLVE